MEGSTSKSSHNCEYDEAAANEARAVAETRGRIAEGEVQPEVSAMPTDTKRKRDNDTDVAEARAGGDIRGHTAEGEVHAMGSAMPTGVKRKRVSNKEVAEGASSGANLAGMVFFCNNIAIRDECLKHNVIAVPERLKFVVDEVKRGMTLFLYDKECLHGVFKASSDSGMNLVPEAFAGFDEKRPAQVRFEIEQKDASVTKCALVEDAVTTASMRLSNEQVAMLKGNFTLKTGEANFDDEGARLSARDSEVLPPERDLGAGLTKATGDPRVSARDQNEPVDASRTARGGHDVAATVPSAAGDPVNAIGDDELPVAAGDGPGATGDPRVSARDQNEPVDASRTARGGNDGAATVPSAAGDPVNAIGDDDLPVAAGDGPGATGDPRVSARDQNEPVDASRTARGGHDVAATVPSAEGDPVNAIGDDELHVAAGDGPGADGAARGGSAAARGGHVAATVPSAEAGPVYASDDDEPLAARISALASRGGHVAATVPSAEVAARGGRAAARGGSATGRGGHVMAATAASAEAVLVNERNDDEPVAAIIRGGTNAAARGRGHVAAAAPSAEAGPVNAAARGGRAAARGGSAAGRGGPAMAARAEAVLVNESDDNEPVAAIIRGGSRAPARRRRAPAPAPARRRRARARSPLPGISPPRSIQSSPPRFIRSSRPPDYLLDPYYQPPEYLLDPLPYNYQPRLLDPLPYNYQPRHYFQLPRYFQPPQYYFHGIHDSVNSRASAGSRPPVPSTNYRPPRPPPSQDDIDLSLSLAFPPRQNMYDRHG
ncbi:hypothetical protein L7F22_000207 [Adiantum nelumboides]|nr:hypothetical protein [Adiantum nelumboides]